ncbi:MAG: esterase-like activity of phytase family protein [Pseudolabrys sp.]
MKLPGRRWLIAGALFAALAGAVGTFALADVQRYVSASTRIEVQAAPIEHFDNRDPAQTRFGTLQFRGSLALTSKNDAFGGISALHMEPDGARFLAVTDRGSWLRGRLLYRDARPVGVADVEMAPILGADGKALAARGWFDAESLTELDGFFYVGIERVEQIMRFDIRRHGLKARGEAVPVPAEFKTFTRNKGLECLAGVPNPAPLAGRLIAVTERSLDEAGNLRAYLLEKGATERFSVKRGDDFEVSDCTVLLPGDLLLLERSYSPARGVAIRIRRVPLASIKRGALVDGEALIVADLAYQVDNMEGIALHRDARGETVVTLVSDDNFSPLQRNLLLQFTLP